MIVNTVAVGETRRWQGETFIFVWTTEKTIPFHCSSHDNEVVGHCHVWRSADAQGEDYHFWCDAYHEAVMNSRRGVTRG